MEAKLRIPVNTPGQTVETSVLTRAFELQRDERLGLVVYRRDFYLQIKLKEVIE